MEAALPFATRKTGALRRVEPRLALGAALALSLAASARAQGTSEAKPPEAYYDQIVAEVEHEPITLHELEVHANLNPEYRKVREGNTPNSPAVLAVLERTLTLLIQERVLLIEAKNEKITLTKEDEKAIDREVEHEAQLRGNLDELKKTLAQLGVPFDAWVETKRSRRLTGKLILKKVTRHIEVEPERIRKYYEQNKDTKFRREAVTKFFQLDIYNELRAANVPADISTSTWCAAEARRYAESLRERLAKSPAEWRRVVEEHTMNAAEVERAGLVEVTGNRPLREQLVVGETADRLAVGEVSQVVETPRGFYVICMKERSAASVLPFSEVQKEIAERLRNQLWEERWTAYVKDLTDLAYKRVYFPPGKSSAPNEPAPLSDPQLPSPPSPPVPPAGGAPHGPQAPPPRTGAESGIPDGPPK